MGKEMETKKKKKKGRPSLLDLQKRNLKEQQQQQQQQLHKGHKNSALHSSPNYKSATATPNPLPRRSTRRNPNPDEEEEEEEEEEKNEQLDRKKRREKKLKLVLKLPNSSSQSQQRSDRSDSNEEEDDNAASDNKKRKINAIGDGSELFGDGKVEKLASGAKSSSNQQGAQLDSGPSTPLPDKKLLLFILERLQKKDTYGVFSDPVDPEELPDYHEIIEHPMDFSTVKKKLAGGAYACLEDFEKDIFLICSNAMQYNAPDTIYFRQARSIQELAKRNFENLRQDSDDNKPEPKVVRRGRPPTKNLKKPLGRPSLERTGSEFSDATLATGGDNSISANYDARKGPHSDKSGLAHGTSRNGDSNWLAENKFDWNDEFTGSILKSNSKLGNKHFVLDENRRHTYQQFHPSAGGREPSVLAIFSLERKQLMAVGLHSEQGYARSLARFAANLGPVAWKIASKRMERSLSAGIKFGPGWVGENDVLQQRPLTPPAPPSSELPSSQALPVATGNSLAATAPHPAESKEDKSSENHEEDKFIAAKKSPEPFTEKSKPSTGLKTVNEHNPPLRQGMNGINGAYGFNLPAQMDKLVGSSRPIQSPQVLVENTSKLKPTSQLPSSGPEVSVSPRSGSWQGSSPQQKPDLAPPDLNIRFQSPGSPSSSRTDLTHPDLALQL